MAKAMRNYPVSTSLTLLFTVMLDDKYEKAPWQKRGRVALKKAWRGKKTSICLDDCFGVMDHLEYTLDTLHLYCLTPKELVQVRRSGWAFYTHLHSRYEKYGHAGK